jgi:hypothetical protein
MPVIAPDVLTHQGINPKCIQPLPPGPSETPEAQQTRILRCRAGDDGREQLERFASRSFHRHHRACSIDFLPTLLGLEGTEGRILATVGYRGCGRAPVFLEQYLPLPIERHIKLISGVAAERHDIAEIGNLAAKNSYWAHQLFCNLAYELSEQGFQWAVFTATCQVRRIFSGVGIELLELGVADPDQLGDAAYGWGSYYENAPRVMAGCIDAAMPKFTGRGIDRSGSAQ